SERACRMLAGIWRELASMRASGCHRHARSEKQHWNAVSRRGFRQGRERMEIDRIEPGKTAMIVVDMQNDFVAPGGGLETPAARAMVPNLVEALRICRSAGIKVIYTTHVHRRDGSDMGLFDDLHPAVANRTAVVDGTPGVEIYREVAPAADEH